MPRIAKLYIEYDHAKATVDATLFLNTLIRGTDIDSLRTYKTIYAGTATRLAYELQDQLINKRAYIKKQELEDNG